MDRLCCPICFGGYRGSACSGHLETTALSGRKATCRPGFFDFPASRLRVLWIGSIRLASLISALRVVRAVVDGAYQSLVQRVCQVRQLGRWSQFAAWMTAVLAFMMFLGKAKEYVKATPLPLQRTKFIVASHSD